MIQTESSPLHLESSMRLRPGTPGETVGETKMSHHPGDMQPKRPDNIKHFVCILLALHKSQSHHHITGISPTGRKEMLTSLAPAGRGCGSTMERSPRHGSEDEHLSLDARCRRLRLGVFERTTHVRAVGSGLRLRVESTHSSADKQQIVEAAAAALTESSLSRPSSGVT